MFQLGRRRTLIQYLPSAKQRNMEGLSLPPTRPPSASGQRIYFISGAAAVDTETSEFQMSASHFHLPSACFFQTSTYLPLSVTGFPLASLAVNSYVPLT